MIVKELFNNVDFDDVATALLDILRYDEPSMDLASYKRHLITYVTSSLIVMERLSLLKYIHVRYGMPPLRQYR